MAESYVGKPCPKCKHVRGPNEASPDWQCPKCGVAYAKFLAAQQGAATTMTGTTPAARGSVAQSSSEGFSTGLAMFVHLSILIGFIVPFFSLIVPIVVWITKKGKDDLATANAKEAINFQISMLIWILVAVGLALLGSPMIYVAVMLAIVLVLAYVILPIIGAVKANGGDQYRYPYTIHIFS